MRVRLGIEPTVQQEELCAAMAPNGARVTCRAGHGVGKTTTEGALIWWHTECFEDSKTFCTAPTADQLYYVLWAELAKVLGKAEKQADRLGLTPEFRLTTMFRLVKDRLYWTGERGDRTWFAQARTARKEKPDALAGRHASDIEVRKLEDGTEEVIELSESGGSLLLVLEEASGIPDEIVQVAEGALSSSKTRLLMVGNPVRNTGFFARSHKEERSSFTSTLHFACSKSPLVSPDYRLKLVKKYGEGSNVVRVRADGEFPKQDDDVLIPIELAEAALERDLSEEPDDGSDLLMGVDVARYGSDRTVILLRRGRRVLEVWIRSLQSTMETAGQVFAIYSSLSPKPRRVCVDGTGLGAGVVDRLKELGVPVSDVVVSEVATLAPVVRTRQTGFSKEARFQRRDALPNRLRDYLWLAARDWLVDSEPSFADIDDKEAASDLAGELASVTYVINSDGKLVVESKDDRKRRLKDADGTGRSPDIADALCLTFAPETSMSVWDRLGA